MNILILLIYQAVKTMRLNLIKFNIFTALTLWFTLPIPAVKHSQKNMTMYLKYGLNVEKEQYAHPLKGPILST